MYIKFLDVAPAVRGLLKKANGRVHNAMRPSTQTAYSRYFRIFVTFTVFAQVEVHDVTTSHVLAFLEFLVFNKFSPAAILNVTSAVKSRLQAYGMSIKPWQDTRVAYFSIF